MKKHFPLIKAEYEKFYKFLLKQGKLPYRDTKMGVWGPSVTDDVFEFFKKFDLSRFENFIDLGSGDGKVVLLASLFTKSTGIEHDSYLHTVSNHIKKKLNLSLQAEFIKGDYFKHDIRDYDLVFVSPDKPMYRGLEKKLFNELNGLIVVSGDEFHPQYFKKRKTLVVNTTPFTVYSRL